ncbi:MAG: tetratricopeptide repeat protein [Planctomycetaceae bacterium]
MKTLSQRFFLWTLLLLFPAISQGADIIYLRTLDANGDREKTGGTVTAVTKTDVTVTVTGKGEVKVPANDIEYIEWDGAPPDTGLAIAALGTGQSQRAIDLADKATTAISGAGKDNLVADLDFIRASALADQAMTDSTKRADAIAKLKDFVGRNRAHYRFYRAQLVLGDVALGAGDFVVASDAFTAAAGAPWKDFQMAAQIGTGRSLLLQNNVDGARKEFDAVVAMKPEGVAEKAKRLEAMVGQARCLHAQKKYQEAVDALNTVIDESSAASSRLQAEAYVLQGAAYAQMSGREKDAIMSYLHVDVVPTLTREQDYHAEALYHLVQLYSAINDAPRAGSARAALEVAYGNSQWAKKLTE